jgi:hypothetical protein
VGLWGECVIKEPEWKYNKTVKKQIQVLDVDEERREVDALDLEAGMPFCLDANEEIELAEIEVGKMYQATFKVYRAEITPEIEKHWAEMAKDDTSFREGVQRIKASGSSEPLFKFELISIKLL